MKQTKYPGIKRLADGRFHIRVTGRCPKTGKKKNSWKCSVSGSMTVFKYKASQASGSLKYTIDTAFQSGGKVTKNKQKAYV